MYKTITIKTLQDTGSNDFKVLTETLKNYKLCYIDDINRTYYDYTPEAKAYRETEEWKEQDRLRTEKLHREGHMSSDDPEFSLWANSILKRGADCQDYPNPDCIPGEQEMYAYFTPLPLEEQWGDDWNDSPYDCNAGCPYDDVTDEVKESETCPGVKYVSKSHEITIIQIPFTIKSFNTRYPKDWGCNSPFCVDDINRGAVAWIYDFNYHNKKSVCIYAGINPFDFVEKIKEIETNNPDWYYSPDDYDE